MSATLEIRAPAEQTEGTRSQVLRWLKAVGQTVEVNEPLIELETDKVTVEIAAPASGILREICKQEQEEIEPGDVLGLIESARAAAAAGAQDSAAAHVPSIPPAPDTRAQPALSTAASVATAASASSVAPGSTSPAVRRLLAQHGLDASHVKGSGAGGRITVDDVLQYVAALSTSASVARPTSAADNASLAKPAPAAGQSSVLEPRPGARDSETDQSIRRVPHTAMRKRVAEHMVQSLLHTSPHVTSVFEADMSAVLAHRARHKDEFEQRGAPLTLTAYFVAAIVDGIRAVPEANSRWADDALEVFDHIHVGVATALGEQGLLVPVLRNVESLDLAGIAAGLQRLITSAREGKLTPADVRGGTFTISNHGVSGSLLATPIIINQPQSAILGVGKLEKRVSVMSENGEDRVVVKPKCYVTLTIDHRVMDGYQTNAFLQAFVKRLESWPHS